MNNQIIINNIQDWLNANDKSQKWLADEIGVTTALISLIFSQQRKLQTKYIISISKAIGVSLEKLTSSTEAKSEKEPQVSLRGKLSTEASKRKFEQLLWDIENCVNLGVSIHE